MQIFHQSRSKTFRCPFGARPAGSLLTLAVETESEADEIDFVLLNYAYGLDQFYDGKIMMDEQTQPVDQTGAAAAAESKAEDRENLRLLQKRHFSSAVHLPGLPCLLFYWFEVRLKNKGCLYLCAHPSHDGSGLITSGPPLYHALENRQPQPFQVTVYRENFATPQWFQDATLYQIFPDRFRRGADFDLQKFHRIRPEPERIYHDNWAEEVDIRGLPGQGYQATDFYGGSLKGIQEGLPYLRELGITALYLNPIFMAKSNHRYDTADYMNVDPLLGTNADFEALCQAAARAGIRIILDGVFSHTGADSIYFNKYGRFPGIGAYQAVRDKSISPFFGWYNIHQNQGQISYDSWWNFPELPAVREHDLTFREFILGEDGVLATWLRRGAAGFRLDVSDELPDDFISELRQRVKKVKADAVIIGEVWEDASNKVSYGHYRDFLLGNTHDGVMGYPFRQALVSFFKGTIAADELNNSLETLRENYPPQALACNMNLISSHDVSRFITEVAGPLPPPENREDQIRQKLDPAQRAVGEKKLYLACFLQVTCPGVPSIYYGDEIGMEGYRDPLNRRCFNWQQTGSALNQRLKELLQLRRRYPLLVRGNFECLSASGSFYAFRRYIAADGLDYCGQPYPGGQSEIRVLLNAGDKELQIRQADLDLTLEPYSACLLTGNQQLNFKA
ncbi:MAG: glycoside hydrolase family 13 protein [Oscillospiraceae bacterium]|nr:glycoside hydrolase family 13 protein [Oscillospiraceae bacterium]MDD4367460.1 glycoside hydrolase family 13 protein [Oscillospiraceae bacterium]